MDNQPSNPEAKEIIKPADFVPVKKPMKKKNVRLKPISLVIIAGLIISAYLAWYIVTGRSVYIETQPTAANFEVTGGIKFKLADRFLLREQTYRLFAHAQGYYDLNQDLQISDESSQYFLVELKKLPGHLRIDTSPDATAEVWINDISYGVTPLRINNLEPDTYSIRLEADRFFSYETEVDIEGLDKEQALVAELTQAWANIGINSFPAGADVFVDDEVVGQTPINAEVLQGERDIRIKLPGYKLWRKALRVIANEDQTIETVNLEPADALVQIITVPDSANITINGEYIGQSPVEAALSPGVRTTVNAFKPGFIQASRTVQLASGDNSTLKITLETETASIQIWANPPDAMVLIDGKPSGQANQTIELSATPHTIEIRKNGHIEFKTTVTPRPGIAQQINVELKTLEQARLESIKSVIQTAAGQSLKLFEPVSITMGASRREPGRRANETLRTAQFSRQFYLSEKEVTNTEFKKFMAKHESGNVNESSLNGGNHPVVNITWEQAALYCNWLSKQDNLPSFYIESEGKITGFNAKSIGYRLPSEAEWEWAARHSSAGELKFPWGNELPPRDKSGNYADISAAPIIGRIIENYNDGQIVSAPVGSYTPNSKGLYDLGGNVSEWVNDFYDILASMNGDAGIDPLGPETGEHHVIKGSSWAHGTVSELRLSYRDYGSDPRTDVGFRIARYLQ
jgi:formylglycine-generating enzyme required for sulfatase activity